MLKEKSQVKRLPSDDVLPRQGPFADLIFADLLYQNALDSSASIADWRLEGQIGTSYPNGRLRLESVLPKEQGQKANFVLWCPVELPDGVCIEFDFYPIQEPGLAMFWFCARGRGGEDLFDPRLAQRSGEYDHYRFGDIDAYHAAYFRRGRPGSFQICNLRKSHGFRLVAQSGDPIPSGTYEPPYRIRVLVRGGWVQFEIDELVLYTWHDDAPLRGGKIGFREMAPLIAEYADLKIWQLGS